MVRWGSQTDSDFGDDGSSAPFLDDTVPTARRWPPLLRLGRGPAVLILLVVVGCTVVFGVAQSAIFPYRVGWAGTPGTLSEVRCVVTGSAKHSYTTCTGQYTSDDGSIVVPDVRLDVYTSVVAGRSYPARLHPDDVTVSVSDRGSVADGLAGLLLCVAIIELALGYAVIGAVRRRRDPRRGRPGRRPPVVVTTIGAVFGLAALTFWIIANVAP